MPHSEDRYEYHDERVSTEPQRKALDAMSEDLVRKLHTMVAEQEARARDFAAHQHSLSSLPMLQQHFPRHTQNFDTPPPYNPGTITNGPRIKSAKKKQQTHQQSGATLPDWHTQFDSPPPPTPTKKESGCGVGTIITCIIIFLIILRCCS